MQYVPLSLAVFVATLACVVGVVIGYALGIVAAARQLTAHYRHQHLQEEAPHER